MAYRCSCYSTERRQRRQIFAWEDECAFAFGHRGFVELAVVEPLQFGIVAMKLACCVDEVITQVTVSAEDQMVLLGFKTYQAGDLTWKGRHCALKRPDS
jgi:hypothetical protein